MELVSATRRAIDSGPGRLRPAVREAAEALAVLMSLFAPYTAEECWECSGHKPSVGGRPGGRRPGVPDPGDGHLRRPGEREGAGQVKVSPAITEDELRELALAAPGVARAWAHQVSGSSCGRRS